MKLRPAAGQSRECDVEILSHQGPLVRARIDGREVAAQVEALPGGGAMVAIDGRRFRVASTRRKDTVIVTVGPRTFDFVRIEEGARRGFHGLTTPQITAPMPGKVLRILVAEGDTVAAGQALVVLEAMKMETTLAAESDAIVKRVPVAAGQMVDHGAVLIELSPPAASPSAAESGSPAS
jgi:3-methylcrotonyl-CoA carboxylase alpha subunit